MAKKVIIGIIAVVVVGVGVYFWPKGGQRSSQVTPGPSLPQTFSTPEPDAVAYTDAGYSPNTLRIKAGTTVAFINENSRAMWTASDIHPSHRTYAGSSMSEHCPDTAGTAFDACIGIQPGNSWSFKFAKKGTWNYHNHLMPSHIGTVVVE